MLSDFWTSVGIVVGLLLVRAPGIWWLDPVTAGVVARNLMWTGFRLVRTSTPFLPSPARSPASRPITAEPGASTAPAKVAPSVAAMAWISVRPMRPPAPATISRMSAMGQSPELARYSEAAV